MAEIPPPEDLLVALGDVSRPVAERRAALRSLSTLAFNTAGFAAYRADFTQALRDLTVDSDVEMREVALMALVQAGDSVAENLLTQGLQDSSQAVVPAVKALELLRLDPHAATATIARNVLANSTDLGERTQATYLLTADPTAASLLLGLLADTTEDVEVRQAAAIGLREIDESGLTAAARAIVADAADNWAVRAICRTQLALLLPDEFDFEDDEDWIA